MNKLILVFMVSTVISLSAGVICPSDNPDGDASYYPHETECGKFYECNAGKAAILECPPGLYFDVKLNVCNWNVDCGNLLTTTGAPGSSPAPGPSPTDAPASTDAPAPTDAPTPSSEAAEY